MIDDEVKDSISKVCCNPENYLGLKYSSAIASRAGFRDIESAVEQTLTRSQSPLLNSGLPSFTLTYENETIYNGYLPLRTNPKLDEY